MSFVPCCIWTEASLVRVQSTHDCVACRACGEFLGLFLFCSLHKTMEDAYITMWMAWPSQKAMGFNTNFRLFSSTFSIFTSHGVHNEPFYLNKCTSLISRIETRSNEKIVDTPLHHNIKPRPTVGEPLVGWLLVSLLLMILLARSPSRPACLPLHQDWLLVSVSRWWSYSLGHLVDQLICLSIP